MQGIKDIVVPVLLGFRDSFRGTIVILTIDKEMSDALKKSPSKTDPRKRFDNPVGNSPAKYSKVAKDQRFGATITLLRILTFQFLESKVLKRMIQCMFLNLSVSLASVIFLEYMLMPFLMLFIRQFVVFCNLSNYTEEIIWEYSSPAVKILFGTLWILPIYSITRLVNALWFQDIAHSIYRWHIGRPVSMSSYSKILADFIFSSAVQLLFLCQAFIVSMLPLSPIGEILDIIHMCLLYSLYAFDYKWCNMGWELHRRLEFIENNWPYFVGFGLPMTIATKWIESFVISGCVFAFFFPLLIVSGHTADPVAFPSDLSLRLFSPVVILANAATNKFIGRKRR